MLTESFAEYLSLKITEELIGKDVYQANIEKKLKELDSIELTPISEINSNGNYGDRNLYVYTFAPMNWIKLEQAIGEENMWKWINKLLTVESDFTNYNFLISTLNEVLNDKALLKDIEYKYFTTTMAFQDN